MVWLILTFHEKTCRAAPILVSISVSGQYQYFDGIKIGQVCYTSTNSVAYALCLLL